MTTEYEQLCITVKAECDLSGKQYRAIKTGQSGCGTISLSTADYVIGILQNKPAAYGRAAKVAVAGHTKAIAGAAIATIGYVGVSSDGAVSLVSTESKNVLGKNINTAAGSGEYIEIIIDPFRHG